MDGKRRGNADGELGKGSVMYAARIARTMIDGEETNKHQLPGSRRRMMTRRPAAGMYAREKRVNIQSNGGMDRRTDGISEAEVM